MKPSPIKRKSPLKKRASDSVSKLKQRLWQLCREITFKRYGSDCFTCPARSLTGSNRQCGHFIPSSVCSGEMRYALENLRPQCAACNIWRSGNWPAFEHNLRRDGIDTDALKARNRATIGRKYDSLWYLSKIKEYEEMLASL